MRNAQTLGVVFLVLMAVAGVRGAEGDGQADLDQATLAKLSADSLADLETVAELCDSALAKGLDEKNQAYARDLLRSTLYEQAQQLSRLIFDQHPVDPRWQRIRQISLGKLQRALEIDPAMGNAQLLIAQLQSLPGGDRAAAQAALDKAFPGLADDPQLLSSAHQVRAGLTEDRDQALQDLNKAIELFPRNLGAWRARAAFYMAADEFEKALQDLQELLNRDPDNMLAHQAIAEALRELKQYDKAIEHLNQVLTANPDASSAYALKARIDEEQGNLDAALENLNQAVRVQPQDLGALLYRARLLAVKQQFDLARGDVDQALQLRPGLPQAIALRAVISAAQQRFGDAIGDLQQLLQRQPENVELKMQIAAFYEADRRPRKAVELYSEIVQADSSNWMALRRRGDVHLSISQQAEAIRDYEAALVLQPDDPGLLNNLAWVLATSPHDPLRDGKRALDFARKACELTKYEAPHIISTLAACHAETGDFAEAIKWSDKAVQLDAEEPQLAQELASYRAGKAWREEQQMEENAAELHVPPPDEALPVFEDVPDLDLDLE